MNKLTGKISKTAKTSVIFLAAILLVSCILEPILEPEEETYLDIDEIVELKLGERKIGQPSGLEVGFEKVISDSRCPINIMCSWPGRARIEVILKKSFRETALVILQIPAYVSLADSLGHVAVDTLGYRLSLLQLDPYPVVPVEHDCSEYVATIFIKNNEENKNE
ncbi:MAG: hypothetical protein WC703_00470 [Candidatus Neomarinimicrobiota bacterium]